MGYEVKFNELLDMGFISYGIWDMGYEIWNTGYRGYGHGVWGMKNILQVMGSVLWVYLPKGLGVS